MSKSGVFFILVFAMIFGCAKVNQPDMSIKLGEASSAQGYEFTASACSLGSSTFVVCAINYVTGTHKEEEVGESRVADAKMLRLTISKNDESITVLTIKTEEGNHLGEITLPPPNPKDTVTDGKAVLDRIQCGQFAPMTLIVRKALLRIFVSCVDRNTDKIKVLMNTFPLAPQKKKFKSSLGLGGLLVLTRTADSYGFKQAAMGKNWATEADPELDIEKESAELNFNFESNSKTVTP